MRQLGSLKVFEGGWAHWESSEGIVSLCQFRGKILIALFPDTPATPIVLRVCDECKLGPTRPVRLYAAPRGAVWPHMP